MGSGWESVVVAIGIILVIYFGKKYAPRLKDSQKWQKVNRPKEEPKPLEMILTKKENKQPRTRPLHTSNPVASLVVMHPHSFERAKKEYIHHAQGFTGYYEMLYLACSGKITGTGREQLLKDWEERILSTEAPNFILAWNTVIQKHCGRNLYTKGYSKDKSNLEVEKRILQDWLKFLNKWGLHREPRGQIQSESHRGESQSLGIQELNYYWVLNGEVLEEGQLKAQSFS